MRQSLIVQIRVSLGSLPRVFCERTVQPRLLSRHQRGIEWPSYAQVELVALLDCSRHCQISRSQFVTITLWPINIEHLQVAYVPSVSITAGLLSQMANADAHLGNIVSILHVSILQVLQFTEGRFSQTLTLCFRPESLFVGRNFCEQDVSELRYQIPCLVSPLINTYQTIIPFQTTDQQ